MKHGTGTILVMTAAFLAVIGTAACSSGERDAERQTVSIGDDDLRVINRAEYATRPDGRPADLVSDTSGIERPSSPEEFIQSFHNPPLRQDRTDACWCFAATSLLESDLKRLGQGEIKLSEMHTVYWEFVEKARGFILSRGEMEFRGGSEPNAVWERMKVHGAVPAAFYTGLLPGQDAHNHDALFQEIRNYLEYCRDNSYWDEEQAIASVRGILDKHMGRPPETIEIDGLRLTPLQYLKDILRPPLDDYVSLMSFKYIPFGGRGEFRVPDNWWHSRDYYNVPLDTFMSVLVQALKNGYTAALSGDVSEPGKIGNEDIAFIPTFDIHPRLIDQDSREFRFYNQTSTDDHAVHAVGLKETEGEDWFLIKDSGASAFGGRFPGYYFYRDDYVRLKILVLTLHRDAVDGLLGEIEGRTEEEP